MSYETIAILVTFGLGAITIAYLRAKSAKQAGELKLANDTLAVAQTNAERSQMDQEVSDADETRLQAEQDFKDAHYNALRSFERASIWRPGDDDTGSTF